MRGAATPLDTGRVVRLLARDAVPTLGAQAREEIHRLADEYAQLAMAQLSAGESLAAAQRAFDSAVVDGLQQAAHDLFWNTTWPACPLHHRHPLWFDAEKHAWCCRHEGVTVAPLGELVDRRIRNPGD